ncbi:MAG: ABC transporter ATP-binding protein [Firmicutes bacterium]|nr:ABC transporter ATP-binding protein [Bacillota bacterium]
MLKIEGLTKIYSNGKVGAEDINVLVEAGDICAFIGPNGSGKTTTIKCALGINKMTKGEAFINGISIKENPIECKKQFAYVPDQPDVYPQLTGIQFLNFIADIYQIDATTKEEQIKKYCAQFEIINDLNTPIGAYSHGMRQKIVLASALIRKPKLLVLDEPFVGLDPKAVFELKNIMDEFTKSGGAIFFSSHVLDVVEKICNKVVFIKGGKIIKSGLMADVKKDKSLEQIFLSEVQ